VTGWKRAERRVAGLLGGRRVPVTGRARGDAPDVAHPWLSIEVKQRQRLPGWIIDALRQAAAAAAPEQLPVVVLHEHGQRYGDSLVVLRLADFVDWFGSLPLGDEPACTSDEG
jgi:hypothetical protein